MSCQFNDVKKENINDSGSKQKLSLGNPFLSGKCRPEDTKGTRSNDPDDDEDSDLFPPPPPHPTQSKSGKVDKEAKNSTKGKGKAGGRDKDGKKSVTERENCSVPCLLGLANGGALDSRCPNVSYHGKKHIKI